MLPTPSPNLDDTQPQPTQPIQPRPLLPLWALWSLVIATALTLLGTMGILWVNRPQPLAVAVIPTATIAIAVTARTVSLTIDDSTLSISTTYALPLDILREAGVVVGEYDRLWLDEVAATPSEMVLWTIPVSAIRIQRAVNVMLVEGNEMRQHITTVDTVGDVLYEMNIAIYLADTVQPDVMQAISEGMTITINRAEPITIDVDGQRLTTRVQGGLVRDALLTVGVALIGLDYTIPDENAPVTPAMTIQVVRVTETLISTEQPIPYETVYETDSSLPLDSRSLRQAGQNGTLRLSTRVRTENGVEVSRVDTGQEMVQAPQNAVVVYGTQVVLKTIDTPDGPREYWRVLRVYATSYYPAELGGDTTTSIGETLRKGIVAADPRIIPYRTNVYVANYGTGIIADTGGPRSSPYWIDLGYSDADWVSWSRYVDVYLLTPVPATINYLLPEWTPLRGTTGY